MMLPATLNTLTAVVLTLYGLAATAEDGCSAGNISVIEHWIVEFPLLVETVVTSDTVIMLDCLTISVTGAPTSISTVVTACSTSTNTIEVDGGESDAITLPDESNEQDNLTVTNTETGAAGSSTTLPTPTALNKLFNLYTRSDNSGLSGLLIGENAFGEVVVGEVDAGPLFSINSVNQLIDEKGNFIFFPPQDMALSAPKRDISARQTVYNPVLGYGPSIPPEAVDANFTLDGIVIHIQSPDFIYTPYICTRDPVEQALYIAGAQTIPSDCFSLSLVIVPFVGGPSDTSSQTGVPATTLPSSRVSTHLPSSAGSSTPSSLSMTSHSRPSQNNTTNFPTSISTSSLSVTSSDSSTSQTDTTNFPTSIPTVTSPPLSVPTTSDDLLGSATDIIETSSLQPWCSTILGYTTKTTTVTLTMTSVDSSIATVISGTTVIYQTTTRTQAITVPETTITGTTTPTMTVTTTSTGVPSRTAEAAPANGTPPPLAEFPPDIVSSACSLEATPVTATVTVTTSQTVLVTSFTSTIVPATVYQTITVYTTTTISSGTTTQTVTASATTTTTTITVAPTGFIMVGQSGEVSAASSSDHYMLSVSTPGSVETFTVTEDGQLYSITNKCFYYEGTASNGNTVFFWDADRNAGASNFYTNMLTDGSGLQEILFTDQSTGSPGQWCVELHPEGGIQNVIGNCAGKISGHAVQVRLYLNSE